MIDHKISFLKLQRLLELKQKCKRLILNKGYAYSEIARRLHVSPQYLSRLLNFTIDNDIMRLEKLEETLNGLPSNFKEYVDFDNEDVAERIKNIEMPLSKFVKYLPVYHTYPTVRRVITEGYQTRDMELLKDILTTLERLEKTYAQKRKKY